MINTHLVMLTESEKLPGISNKRTQEDQNSVFFSLSTED